MTEANKEQEQELVFALDIGTRSIIGVAGRPEGERFQVLAIERAEHQKRAMLDGQIEDIDQVADMAARVARRLGERLGRSLRRVSIAAAGRALRMERGRFALSLPGVRRVDDELIGQLEAGAVSEAERALTDDGEAGGRFFLVGYTVSQYLLDRYPLSTLRGHNGQELEAEVVATFLPAEVVESLYTAMGRSGLEVASLTLEPIAALNVAIPADLRLLNLVMADIGAGTSDIAACRDGSVVGYTMATVAGDEITEAIMRAFLVDFATAERLKAGLSGGEPLEFRDILGLEQQVAPEALRQAVEQPAKALAEELCRRIVDLNGGAPSALFLAGGGSKLDGLKELMARTLGMDPRRVAVAGEHFQKSAFSEQEDLNDPELATPLGIAVSAGLGLINDSCRVTLNGQPAKLFRSGSLTALDVLLMNGYVYGDLIGRTGQALSVLVDGERVVFHGAPAEPCVLRINEREAPPSTVVHAGDRIDFTPARPGAPAVRTLAEAVGGARWPSALVNGAPAEGGRTLESGDEILLAPPQASATAGPAPAGGRAETAGRRLFLNGAPLTLPAKPDGAPYYLMDLLEQSGIDFEHLDRRVTLRVNGEDGQFSRELMEGDAVQIQYEDE